MKTPISPAVESLRKQQAADKAKTTNDDLQNAIEDTFPASDPLSVTQNAVPSGRTDVEAADELENSADAEEPEYPLADAVLNDAENLDKMNSRYDANRDELRALSDEVAKLSETVCLIGNASARLAKTEVQSQVRLLKRRVRKQPLFWMTMAATAGFVWGSTRHR